MRLRQPPLIPYTSITRRVQELADQISSDVSVASLQVIVVLKGAVFFAVDLLKYLPPVGSVDFFKISTYIGNKSRGKVDVQYLPTDIINAKDVLLVEDILDTGYTTSFILDWLSKHSPQSIRLCVLIEKMKPRVVSGIKADYVGYRIEDEFVVGYGMDFNGMYRNLRDIYVLEVGNEDV